MSKSFVLKRDPKPLDSTDKLSLLGSSYDFCEVHRMVNVEEKHKSYAVKIIDFHVTRRFGIKDSDILRESQVLQHIAHPNLVKYHHSYSEFGHTLSLVMDLVIGNNIDFFVAAKDRPSHHLQYKWFVQVMSALDHLKSLGHMAHGDIQPKNIIINSTTCDAKLVGICLPSLRQIITPMQCPPLDSYMSAERLCGEPYDDRDDMWSLGVVFAELLLGLRREVCIWGTDSKSISFQKEIVKDCMHECSLMGHFISQMITPSASTRSTLGEMKRCIELTPTDHPPHNCSSRFPFMSPKTSCTGSSVTVVGDASMVSTSHVGAGDVILIENFLSAALASSAKCAVQKEATWCHLHGISYDNSVPRLASFQASIDMDGTLPVYRTPDPQPWHRINTTTTWSPTVELIRREVELAAGHSFNWCRILHFKEGGEGVGSYSDKWLDLRPGSFVATVSLGEERAFSLRGKHRLGKDSLSDGTQKLKLKHNSLLLVGPNTSMHFLQSVEKSSGRSKSSGLITLTFRDVSTFYFPLTYSRLDLVSLYGQGSPVARSKAEMVAVNRSLRRRYTVATASVSLFAGAVGAGVCSCLLTPLWPEVWSSKQVCGLVTCGSIMITGIVTQIVHIYRAHVKRQLIRRRLTAFHSLSNFLPMDSAEALRIVTKASGAEISHLLKRCRESTGSVMKSSCVFSGGAGQRRGEKKLTFNLPSEADSSSSAVSPRPTTPSRSAVGTSNKSIEETTADGVSSASAVVSVSSSLRPLTAPCIGVCVMIDPVKDFLYGSGAFAQAFGLQDTLKIRHMKQVLGKIYHCCHDRGIQVILVKSKYTNRQFRSVPGLCCTESGREFAFECEECSGSCCVNSFTNDIIITKTSNSILDCDSDESRELLSCTVQNKAVFICGVTTVACVNRALHDLMPLCSSLHIAKDGVASRGSSEEREAKLFRQWGGDLDDDRGDPGYENVHVVDSWETCLLYRRGG